MRIINPFYSFRNTLNNQFKHAKDCSQEELKEMKKKTVSFQRGRDGFYYGWIKDKSYQFTSEEFLKFIKGE